MFDVAWNALPKARWDRLLAPTGAALHQHWAYGAALESLGARVRRAVVRRGEETVALAQVTTRNFGLARVALCTRGPVWLADLTPQDKAENFRLLRRTVPLASPNVCVFTPDVEPDDPALSLARLRRVMTGQSTAVLDLRPPLEAIEAAQKPKWRNRRRAGEAEGLKITEGGAKADHYRWLLEAEAGQRDGRGYRALPPAFVEAFAGQVGKAGGVRVWRADFAGAPIAGMLFLRHGSGATYHAGWASEAGRVANAHPVLLWRAIQALKADGATWLDLGGVDTVKSAGIARFKLGAGAQPVTLAGTYC